MNKKIQTTDFNLLQTDFNDIIFDIIDNGSSRLNKSKIIKFHNGYKMTIEETLNKDYTIYQSHYDLIGKDQHGNDHIVFGFHCQSHTRDSRYTTKTDPHHIHLSKMTEYTTMDRLDNNYHQELPKIMELIRILFQFEQFLIRKDELTPKNKKKKK